MIEGMELRLDDVIERIDLLNKVIIAQSGMVQNMVPRLQQQNIFVHSVVSENQHSRRKAICLNRTT